MSTPPDAVSTTREQRAPKFHGTKVIPPLDFSLPESIPYLRTD